MNDVLQQIAQIGIVPVVRIDEAETALPLAKALLDGGLPCAEITFRTEQAEGAIRDISRKYPEMLVGAGTVLTVEQAKRAIDAGAKFIVTPGFNPKVVEHCLAAGTPITPGVSSASDIDMALNYGIEIVKFFPAEASGGIKAIKALAAPYGKVRFMPTGGIGPGNLLDYLCFSKVLACGGSWMVDPARVAAKDFAGITVMTKEAVQLVLGLSVVHIGINATDAEEAGDFAKSFADLLSIPYLPGNSSDFAGKLVEVMKGDAYGEKGHLAIGTHSVARAMSYFERHGATFRSESIKLDANGQPKVAYFTKEIGGFAIHLVQK